MKTGSLIKLLRTQEGLSQSHLASELGIARTYLSSVENNKVTPSLNLLRAVSKRFAIPISLLVIEDYNKDDEISGEIRKLLSAFLSARFILDKSKRNDVR